MAWDLGGPWGDMPSPPRPPSAPHIPHCLPCPSPGLGRPYLISRLLLPSEHTQQHSSLFKQMFLCVSDCYSGGNRVFSFTKWRLYFSWYKMLGSPNTQMVDRLLAQGKSWGGEMVILQSLNILYFRHGPLVLYLCLSNIRNPGWLQAGRVPHSPRPRRLVLRLTCHSGGPGRGGETLCPRAPLCPVVRYVFCYSHLFSRCLMIIWIIHVLYFKK